MKEEVIAEAMNKKNSLKVKRGAIKVIVSTSEPVVDASGDFSIYVIIENPYDVPITLYSVETHIPVQLVDSIWYQRFSNAQRNTLRGELNRQKGWRKVTYWVNNTVRRLSIALRTPTSPRIAEAVGTENKDILLELGSEFNASIEIGGATTESNIIAGSFNEIWRLEFPDNPSNEDLDRIFMKIEDYRMGKIPTILQPGNAVVKHFVLKAKKKLFFRPIAYKFQIQIRYAADDEEQLDTVPFNLQIRAPTTSIMGGAIFGSALGTLARSLGQGGGSLSLVSFALAAIFGAIAVIAFARKESAQTIVSIEDFWGGVIIGFLIGYLGESYFQTIVGL